jgi:hypothetical protein
MKNTAKTRKPAPAKVSVRLADQGKDVSSYFTNSGRLMEPIQRVNVDFTATMLEELEKAAQELNIAGSDQDPNAADAGLSS